MTYLCLQTDELGDAPLQDRCDELKGLSIVIRSRICSHKDFSRDYPVTLWCRSTVLVKDDTLSCVQRLELETSVIHHLIFPLETREHRLVP